MILCVLSGFSSRTTDHNNVKMISNKSKSKSFWRYFDVIFIIIFPFELDPYHFRHSIRFSRIVSRYRLREVIVASSVIKKRKKKKIIAKRACVNKILRELSVRIIADRGHAILTRWLLLKVQSRIRYITILSREAYYFCFIYT